LAGISDELHSILLWPAISVLTCTVIYAAIRAASPINAVLASRIMVEVGKRSYGLYLWHVPILVLIDIHWGLETWAPRLAGLAVTAMIVPLSYRYIERPFLERKDARRPEPVPEPAPVRAEPATAMAQA
jgi:peptidoglycan/LPS O-acetylase OafA/YrhL